MKLNATSQEIINIYSEKEENKPQENKLEKKEDKKGMVGIESLLLKVVENSEISNEYLAEMTRRIPEPINSEEKSYRESTNNAMYYIIALILISISIGWLYFPESRDKIQEISFFLIVLCGLATLGKKAI